MLMYSVFDRKLQEYGNVVLARNDEHIRRNLIDGVKGSKSVMELHPEDFDLVCLGTFDELKGEVSHVHMDSSGVAWRSPRLIAGLRDMMEAANGR